jgi:CRISPR system Cascade subunit CasD
MPDFLVVQLHGALASWGDIAVGEHRPSLGHPSKSAVTGLLAAALGIDREDDDMHSRLASEYGVAICVRAAGELLRDYHTVQVPGGKCEYATRRDELLTDKLNLNTILSQRDYHTDTFYQVAIWCSNEGAPFTLESLQQHLRQPHYTLYLGRKSCPIALPLHPVIFSGISLKQAFDDYPHSKAEGWTEYLGQSPLINYFWEGGKLKGSDLGMSSSMTYPRRDQVRSRKRWQFSSRDEFYYAETIGEGA